MVAIVEVSSTEAAMLCTVVTEVAEEAVVGIREAVVAVAVGRAAVTQSL